MLVSSFALLLALRGTPKIAAYRWQAIPVGSTKILAVALAAKDSRTIVAAGDVGYVIGDPKRPERIPMARVTGVAIGDYDPERVVAVGSADEAGNLRFSLDGGGSWLPCPLPPALEGGAISVGSDGKSWVWSGVAEPQHSGDYGFTWRPCGGLPAGATVVADRSSSRRFYALSGGQLYVSDDGGDYFEPRDLNLPEGEEAKAVVATPGRVGDLWLLTQHAVYRSHPGLPFERVPGITDPTALGFGMGARWAMPARPSPTLYVAGRVEGVTGLFRTTDEGQDWSQIVGAPSVEEIVGLVGDPARFGSIFVFEREGGLVRGDAR